MGSGLPYRRHEDLDALLNLLRTAAGTVAQQIGTEHPNLARLSAPDTSPIWFDTNRADGLLFLLALCEERIRRARAIYERYRRTLMLPKSNSSLRERRMSGEAFGNGEGTPWVRCAQPIPLT
jgi:hypothetical protein